MQYVFGEKAEMCGCVFSQTTARQIIY